MNSRLLKRVNPSIHRDVTLKGKANTGNVAALSNIVTVNVTDQRRLTANVNGYTTQFQYINLI